MVGKGLGIVRARLVTVRAKLATERERLAWVHLTSSKMSVAACVFEWKIIPQLPNLTSNFEEKKACDRGCV